jgi:hypothetical protein
MTGGFPVRRPGLRDLLAAHAECVRYAVDVVEPRSDERDLQNRLIVEPDRAQALVIVFRNLGRILCQLYDVVHHCAFCFGDRSRRVIRFQSIDQRGVQGYATQKLCVGVDSIDAPIGNRNHGGDHLVLPALEREIRRHQSAEGGKRMPQGFGDETVRLDDLRAPTFRRVNRRGVLDRVEVLLSFHRLEQGFVAFR